MAKASIIIPTYNSARTLDECLKSSLSNNSKYPFEVIVVDKGSTDETLSIAQKHGVKCFVELGSLRGKARNVGIKQASGDIVCFTDSDCVAPLDWIDQLVDNLLKLNKEDKRIVGVGGPNLPVLERASLASLAIAKAMRSPLIAFQARNVTVEQKTREVLHNPPVNSAYFKEVIEEVGGFGEAYNIGEDLEMDAKLIKKGYKLFYVPSIFVHHHHRSSFRSFVRQMYEFGKARMRVGKQFKKFISWYHFGPLLLCIMTFSPLIVIPLLMALANSACVSFQERNIRLFLPLLVLTMAFYVSYGGGEIVGIVRGGLR